MLTYNIQYDKSQQRIQHPITKIWSWVMVPQYTPAQYEILEGMVQDALGADFISFELQNYIGHEMVVLTYQGAVVDEVEQHRFDLLDPLYQQFYLDQLGVL